MHKIEVASGMRDEDVEVEQEEEKTEHPDILSEHRMEDLRRHAEDLKEFDKAESESDEDDLASATTSEEFLSSPNKGEASSLKQELLPVSSLRWSVLSPKSRNLFKEGLMAGQRLEKRRNQVKGDIKYMKHTLALYNLSSGRTNLKVYNVSLNLTDYCL